jgi:hypothetical protein
MEQFFFFCLLEEQKLSFLFWFFPGRGAYFADGPRKSNGYAQPDQQTNWRVIFYNKVLLGIESVQIQTDNSLSAAPT